MHDLLKVVHDADRARVFRGLCMWKRHKREIILSKALKNVKKKLTNLTKNNNNPFTHNYNITNFIIQYYYGRT